MKERFLKERIHFIGAGGVSMSALAQDALVRRWLVSGSDVHCNGFTDKLKALGAYVYEGGDTDVIESAERVVYSSAIKEDDRELSYARERGIPCIPRSEYLAEVADGCKICVAVGGIHGKSTVTSLTASALKSAGKRITAHIGAEALDLGGNYFNSGRDFFVTEACEYRGNFLALAPDIAVILNVEMDHPDYYGDEESVYDNFRRFTQRIKTGGKLIINSDEKYKRVYEDVKNIGVITFGINDGDYSARNLRKIEGHNGGYVFDLYVDGIFRTEINNKLFGRHNVLNALACLAVADACGAESDAAIRAIESFKGVKRRFEILCLYNSCHIISDYAHHPSEIRATIASAKEVFGESVAVCFQPHTYSRTERLMNEFLTCFDGADRLIIAREYAARETPDMGKSAYELYLAIKEEKRFDEKKLAYADEFGKLKRLVKEEMKNYTCLLVLGAGDMAEGFENFL
ncbi:MAG: UDP-N-acetylmuramate--L-alanine ligase [Clostridiales bacterium]|jgi:UDP-N-acetylmuramate--alanine ligase|nr:UDP-N-acetylmuramate--L-alanine ligase [Clostridiales bacterium]